MHTIGQFYTKWKNHYDNPVKEITVLDESLNHQPKCRFFVKEESNEFYVYDNNCCDRPTGKYYDEKNNLNFITTRIDPEENNIYYLDFEHKLEYEPKNVDEKKYILIRNADLINEAIRISDKEDYYDSLLVNDLKLKLNNKELNQEEIDFINEYIVALESNIKGSESYKKRPLQELEYIKNVLRKECNYEYICTKKIR